MNLYLGNEVEIVSETSYEATSLSEALLFDYKEGIGSLQKKMPKLVDTYDAFTSECFSEGHLSKKQKQLIALGISICEQDEYCIVYHTKGCIDQGCTEEEILEAIGVSAAFGGGRAMSQGVTLVQQAIEEIQQLKH